MTKIRTRLIKGHTKPKAEFRLPRESSWQGDTAGRTIQRMVDARLRQR